MRDYGCGAVERIVTVKPEAERLQRITRKNRKNLLSRRIHGMMIGAGSNLLCLKHYDRNIYSMP